MAGYCRQVKGAGFSWAKIGVTNAVTRRGEQHRAGQLLANPIDVSELFYL